MLTHRSSVPVALLALALATTAADAADALVLRGGRILSPNAERFADGSVLIDGGRIAAIGGAVDVPAGAEEIDVSGLFVLPGLIDLHTHLLLHPYDETNWNDQVLRESLELRTIRGTVAARKTLEAGFTTIRDLGTEGAGFADVAIRDAIDAGIVPGPRVIAVTKALVATGCYGPSGFDPRWEMPVGAQVADGVDGVRKATRQQIAAGADWIKVYADYSRQSDGVVTPTYSLDELKAIVNEATSAGLPVAAHATVDEAIRRAVEAGVATIEHGYHASNDVLNQMKKNGVVLCPTLGATVAKAGYDGWKEGDEEDHPRIAAAKSLMERALEVGVTIACGSDAGVFDHGDNAWEIELMVKYGMTESAAIRAATAGAARVLRMDNELGQLKSGYHADIIVVRGNPLEDVSNLRNVVLVVRSGEVVVDLRSRPVRE